MRLETDDHCDVWSDSATCNGPGIVRRPVDGQVLEERPACAIHNVAVGRAFEPCDDPVDSLVGSART